MLNDMQNVLKSVWTCCYFLYHFDTKITSLNLTSEIGCVECSNCSSIFFLINYFSSHIQDHMAQLPSYINDEMNYRSSESVLLIKRFFELSIR